MHEYKMSVKEREIRDKLAKAVRTMEFLRGTINIRNKKSKINRKKYKTMYLILAKDGKQEHKYVPRDWEEKIKKWVRTYKEIEGYMEKISDICIKRFKNRGI